MPQPSEPLKTSEVPKVEGPAPTAQPKPALSGQSQEEMVAIRKDRDLGRGGAPHQAIQERLQAEAQKLGFLAEVEKQLAKSSNQAADLVLKRGDVAIAVEITVTTTVSHEFENIQKCLKAGFNRVAVIATSPKRLEDIASVARGGLGTEAAAKVGYYSPDDFIAELREVAARLNAKADPTQATGEQKRRGIVVRRHLPELSPEERKLRDNMIQRMLAEALRRPS